MRNFAEILSGPDDLFVLVFCKSFLIPFSSKTISGIVGAIDGPRLGTESEMGENTLENWRLSALAFSLGVENDLPSTSRVDTPLLSVCEFLTYL